MDQKKRKRILADAKGGSRKPTMPAPKQFTDRKCQAKKYACRDRSALL